MRDLIDWMQEEGIPPREASWNEEDIIEDSREERDDDTLSEEDEVYQQDALDTIGIEKDEL